jgi:hypothetical protein
VLLWAFYGYWVQLNAYLRISLWILSAPNVMAVIVLAKSNQNYPSITLMSQGGFWIHGV